MLPPFTALRLKPSPRGSQRFLQRKMIARFGHAASQAADPIGELRGSYARLCVALEAHEDEFSPRQVLQ
jgi:hypothetical protein